MDESKGEGRKDKCLNNICKIRNLEVIKQPFRKFDWKQYNLYSRYK